MEEKNKVGIKILCISDLHLGTNDTLGISGDIASATVKQSMGIDKLKLLKDALKNRYTKEKVDFIFFSGDYLTGRDSETNKEKATDRFLTFLEDIEKMTCIFTDPEHIRERIVIAPGNHDVAREEKDGLKKFKKDFGKYLHPFREYSGGVTKYAPLFIFEKLKLVIYCISTVDNAATKNELISNTIEYIKSLSPDTDDVQKENVLKDLESIKFNDIPTVSALTQNTFIEQNHKIKEYSDYRKIIISHHPLLSGTEKGVTIKEYPNTIGGYQLLNTASQLGYSLFIHGHIHEFSCLEFRDRSDEDKTSVFQIGVPDFQLDTNENMKIIMLELGEVQEEMKIKLLHLDKITRDFKENRYIIAGNSFDNTKRTVESEGVLVDFEIEQIINRGLIVKNADSARIEAASYDCALGKKYRRTKMQPSFEWTDEILEPSSDGPAKIVLQPNETVLIYTEEEFDIPADMILHASPISSWARNGLRVDISHFVDPGFRGVFCFPVTNMGTTSLEINSKDPIMSIEFVKLSKSAKTLWYQRHPDKENKRKKYEDK